MNSENVNAQPKGKSKPGRGMGRQAIGMEYWRVERVAQFLDITPKRVHQLIQEKKLTAIRLSPRGTRVLCRSIEEYLAGIVVNDERNE